MARGIDWDKVHRNRRKQDPEYRYTKKTEGGSVATYLSPKSLADFALKMQRRSDFELRDRLLPRLKTAFFMFNGAKYKIGCGLAKFAALNGWDVTDQRTKRQFMKMQKLARLDIKDGRSKLLITREGHTTKIDFSRFRCKISFGKFES